MRPALPERNKQRDVKRMKLDDAAQSSSAVVTEVNAEPGSSRQEQSIITQDNQPMESAQTETTASDSNGTSSFLQQKDEKLQESLPLQDPNPPRQNTLRSSILDTAETHQRLLGAVEEFNSARNLANNSSSSSNRTGEVSRFPEERHIEVTASTSSSTQNQHSNDDANKPQNSQQQPLKRKIRIGISTKPNPPRQNTLRRSILDTAETYRRLLGAVGEFNSSRNLVNNSSSSSNRTGEVSRFPEERNIEVTASTSSSTQNQHSNDDANKPQNSQRQPQKSKKRIGISTKPNNNRKTSTLQVTKESLSPILTKLLNSVRQALSTTKIQYLVNDQEFQGNHSELAPVHENHLNEIENTLQTDEWMEKETPSAHHGENSDFDTVTDHEVISDHEMSADKAPIERTNNVYGTGITFGNSCADRLIPVQNSTNHQTHSKVVLEQQMLDHFATLFTQMRSTLSYTTDMYNTLRSSILDSAKTYRQLLGAVEEFNSARNLANNSSSSSNRTEEVSRFPEERHIEVTASTSSSTQNQHSNDDANKPPNKKHNSWRLVLPPDYDPHDTKWTLKYRRKLPGLVELMPQSGIYVSYGDLKYCQQVSKDCKSLARRLLSVVFNRNALSVCLSMTERAQASDNAGPIVRPELDVDASAVLLSLVLEHGLQRGWNTDLQPILSTIHNKIQETRFKYGVMVQC